MMKIMRHTPIRHSQLIFVAITTFFMITTALGRR